ncbi:hypothetical protein Q9L58_002941 [Maublancomyces gigas]|uniref:Uncharacterized protein n=1 Tax=Discina gigas TaxID=1032678 RepID=A0ABR3GQY8_9PEZI
MAMVKDGRLREMIKNLTLGERKLTDESSGSGSAATTNSVDERGQEKTSQRMPGVNAKPPQSSTVVLVGEKRKDVGTIAASLKGSVTKKRNWFRSFGKKKEV